MHNKIGTRYVPGTQIIVLPHGTLQDGDDTFLTRKVLLYNIVLQPGQHGADYMRTLHHKAAFIHEGFQHILDTSVTDDSVTIILQARPGSLFSRHVKNKPWSFDSIVTLIGDLGVSLLDAMEERITGFPVVPENLWLSADHDKLSVINYWDIGNPGSQGAVGLCRLMVQLFTGNETISGDFEVMHTHLERAHIPSATPEQKLALVRLVKLICQGQASLSSLIFGLRSLPTTSQKHDVGLIHSTYNYKKQAAREVDEEEDDPVPFAAAKRSLSINVFSKALFGAVFVVVLIFAVWALWPSSKKEQPVVVTPIHTETPTPSNSSIPTAAKPAGDAKKQTEEAVIPTLVGLSQADAEQKALAAGLHYNYVIEANDQPKGTVIRQDPKPGVVGLQGDNVTFWVSKGRP